VYADPIIQAQNDHLVDEERVEARQVTQVIRPNTLPPPPRDAFEQMQRPWGQGRKRREEFWDCSDLDTFEVLERSSSAGTGSGDSAPAQLLAMSKV
jgi:hypothetical protein